MVGEGPAASSPHPSTSCLSACGVAGGESAAPERRDPPKREVDAYGEADKVAPAGGYGLEANP